MGNIQKIWQKILKFDQQAKTPKYSVHKDIINQKPENIWLFFAQKMTQLNKLSNFSDDQLID